MDLWKLERVRINDEPTGNSFVKEDGERRGATMNNPMTHITCFSLCYILLILYELKTKMLSENAIQDSTLINFPSFSFSKLQFFPPKCLLAIKY